MRPKLDLTDLSINDYPKPNIGETIGDWVDRLMDAGLPLHSSDVFCWHWPHAIFDLYDHNFSNFIESLKGEDYFRWGNRVFVSNEDSLMMFKLQLPPELSDRVLVRGPDSAKE